MSENDSIFESYLRVSESGREEGEETPVEKFIFRKRNIEKSKKVTNQPKHYFRMFSKGYLEFSDSSFYSKDEIKQIKKTINSLNLKAKTDSYKVTIDGLEKLLAPTRTLPPKLAKKNREVFQKILRSDFCSNSDQKNRLRHMISSRVYSLRCISRELIKRNAMQ